MSPPPSVLGLKVSQTTTAGGGIDDLPRRRLGRRPTRRVSDGRSWPTIGGSTITRGLGGIRSLHELIAAHVEEPEQVVIGIETDRGLWVSALAASGYQVWAI